MEELDAPHRGAGRDRARTSRTTARGAASAPRRAWSPRRRKHLGYRETGDNDTKFNRWLGAIRGYGTGGFGYPWCHAFVSYCLWHSDNAGAGPRTAGCAAGVAWFSDGPLLGRAARRRPRLLRPRRRHARRARRRRLGRARSRRSAATRRDRRRRQDVLQRRRRLPEDRRSGRRGSSATAARSTARAPRRPAGGGGAASAGHDGG